MDTHRDKMVQEDGGRNWWDATTSQGTPEATRSGRSEEEPSPRRLEGRQSSRLLDVGPLAGRSVRDYISVVPSHPVHNPATAVPKHRIRTPILGGLHHVQGPPEGPGPNSPLNVPWSP